MRHLGVDAGLELEEVQVTPVVLERVVDRLMFRPTMRTRKSCARGEGEVEIDPARFEIEGHVNDLPRSRKAERSGKQRQWGHDENLRRLAWRLTSQFHRLVRAYRRKKGHRVCLERVILRDKKNGVTHIKRKRANFSGPRKIPVPDVGAGLPALRRGPRRYEPGGSTARASAKRRHLSEGAPFERIELIRYLPALRFVGRPALLPSIETDAPEGID